jgi:aryl-alcohol dehydrogenase-like predicted oxidoreductase
MWQVGGAHGAIDPKAAIPTMLAYHADGFTTWDLADHYGPAEDFIGAFRRELAETVGDSELNRVQAFTKWVPRPTRMTRAVVEGAVDVSRRRMGVESLDLLQFHWWDYSNKGYIDALQILSELRDEGKIRHLALTNFDTTRLEQITRYGIRVVANQVQYSLVDRRPEAKLSAFCEGHDIKLLTYGTLGGGLLSERYLDQPEPNAGQLNTASLRKYANMIAAWGDWLLFQDLLRALKEVADKHETTIPAVATRFILDQPAVGGVIIGVRLGVSDHRAENARIFDLTLDDEDRALLDDVSRSGSDLMDVIGDCGDEYRRQN